MPSWVIFISRQSPLEMSPQNPGATSVRTWPSLFSDCPLTPPSLGTSSAGLHG